MIFLYHLLSTLAALLVVPVFAVRSLWTGKKRPGLVHHFGFVPPGKKGDGNNNKTLWLYALSVGEVAAAVPVLERIRGERPDMRLVVSVTTDAGYHQASKLLPTIDDVFYHPLDLFPCLSLALARIQPDLFILTETGFWPGILFLLKQKNIPALLFHGRISKKSMRRYKRAGFFVTRALNTFQTLCMQNQEEVEQLVSLGVDPARLRVIGDTKYDVLNPIPEEGRAEIRRRLGIPTDSPVLVAGSTHDGEEAVLLDVHEHLSERIPGLVLVIAPRRLERVPEIVDLINANNRSCVLRSTLNLTEEHQTGIILLDTIGELADVYSIADAVFIGRSLFAPGGGHSLIEPAAQGKVIFHGPYMEYNQAVTNELSQQGVAVTVKDGAELEEKIWELMQDDARRNALSQKAIDLIEAKKGASHRMADIIFHALENR